MGKKQLIIIVVFSIVGFVGGTYLIKAIKGAYGDEKDEGKKEKTEQVQEGDLPVETDSAEEKDIAMTGDWVCLNHLEIASDTSGECPICNEPLFRMGEGVESDIELR